MEVIVNQPTKRYWAKSVISFLLVLFTMPLGHALMILMEHFLSGAILHTAAFIIGFVGFVMVIIGVFVKGDTKQTLWGLFGGLLFWTGWVEFIFMYYANRFGVVPELDPVTQEVITRPEYLIMPSSFGFFMMFLTIYLFSIRSGCRFFIWCQKQMFGKHREQIVIQPMTRHTSIITFMELNMMMWACYLLLMFCYDDNFLGENHPLTIATGIGCFVGSIFIFLRQLRLATWGANIRMAIATVIIFWTPVEIMGRLDFFSEIWVAPMDHMSEMVTILVSFLVLLGYLIYVARKKH